MSEIRFKGNLALKFSTKNCIFALMYFLIKNPDEMPWILIPGL